MNTKYEVLIEDQNRKSVMTKSECIAKCIAKINTFCIFLKTIRKRTLLSCCWKPNICNIESFSEVPLLCDRPQSPSATSHSGSSPRFQTAATSASIPSSSPCVSPSVLPSHPTVLLYINHLLSRACGNRNKNWCAPLDANVDWLAVIDSAHGG